MYKGLRFLICQPMVYGLVGSTMVALELAEHLTKEGAHVLVYSHFSDQPMSGAFEEIGVRITTDPLDEELCLDNFDYAWIHSQVVPESLVYEFGRDTSKIHTKFIYLHMSIMDWLPDEKSYIWEFEEKTASKTLFAWQEVQEKQTNELLKFAHLDFGIYQNPAPKEFSLLEYTPSKELRNILFIGNQLPDEVIRLQILLKENGYNTVRYSSSGDEYGRITPELLSKFDVVITGSKSVYYCLCAGIPVYIYNYFGRQGYITSRNLKDSIKRNFSGRGYDMSTPEVAYKDLVEGYSKATRFYAKNRGKFIQLFSIDRVLPGILESTQVREIERMDDKYIEMVVSSQRLSRRLFINESERAKVQQELERLRGEQEVLRRAFEEERGLLLSKINAIKESKSYRLGEVAALPIRKLKNVINREGFTKGK